MNPHIKDLIFRIYSLIPRPPKLVILDDYFPNMYQAYRVSEFNYYLTNLKRAEVYTSPKSYGQFLKEYSENFPDLASKVHEFSSRHLTYASLYYVVFLHNAYAYLPIIERDHTPFVLNLYAGGFFDFNQPKSDMMLKKVCASPYLKQIVVSQKNIERYLLEKGYCRAKQLTYIYGAVPSQISFLIKPPVKMHFPKEKATLDICFVAHKAMKYGENKGLDVYVEVAKRLRDLKEVRFHVLGDFTSQDLAGATHKNIIFHASVPFNRLSEFFLPMDLIITPNSKVAPYPFNFEGFPNGATREAAYSGVAVFCTDPYDLNSRFTNRKDLVLIDPDAKDIEKKIRYYIHHPKLLYQIANRGQIAFKRVFNFQTQMKKRLAILNEYL